MLFCPHRSTSQAVGDQLAISPQAALESPFFNSSCCWEHSVGLISLQKACDNPESWRMWGNSPIILFFQKENRSPVGDGLIQSVSSSPQKVMSFTQASRIQWLARVNKNSRQDMPESWTGFLTYPTRSREEQRNFAVELLLVYRWKPWIMERPGEWMRGRIA